MHEITKNGETRIVKERHLQNFLDRGWTLTKAKKTTPVAKKIEAAAEVKPVEPDWDLKEDWADSEESIENNEGEA